MPTRLDSGRDGSALVSPIPRAGAGEDRSRVYATHLIFTSEPLQGENVWIPMEEGEIVAVDWRMRLHRSTDDKRRLSILAS